MGTSTVPFADAKAIGAASPGTGGEPAAFLGSWGGFTTVDRHRNDLVGAAAEYLLGKC